MYTLAEAKRQALVAIDFYNRPGDRASFFDFVVHMHLAWQNLLHANLMQNKTDIFFRDSGGRRFARNPDGSKKTWDLAKCVREAMPANSPVRANIEFFIGLRNQIEHRFQSSIMSATDPQTHALVINFETELVSKFGVGHSLGSFLHFPLFVQTLTPSNLAVQKSLRRDLPEVTRNYITKFEKELSAEVSSSEEFAYRILLTPLKGPKTEADMALNFVRQDDLTPAEIAELAGREGSVIIAEKYRNVVHGDEMLPKDAAMAVESSIPYHFPMNYFTRLRKKWQIGPISSGSDKPLPKSADYCLYSPAFGQFVYKPVLVERMAQALKTEGGFRLAMGFAPRLSET